MKPCIYKASFCLTILSVSSIISGFSNIHLVVEEIYLKELEYFENKYNLKNITGQTFDIEVNDSIYTFTKIEYEGTYFLSSIKTDYLFIESDKSTDEILNILYNSNIHNSYTISINHESEYKYNVILNYLYSVG